MGSGIWKVETDDQAHTVYWGTALRHVRITTSDKAVRIELDGDTGRTFDHVAGASVDVESDKVVVRMKEGQVTTGTYEMIDLPDTKIEASA